MMGRHSAFIPGSRPVIDEAKIVAMRKAGLTQKALSARFGISLTRVGDILKRHALNERQPDKEL